MATMELFNLQGSAEGKVDVADEVWGAPARNYLLSEVVHWQRAKKRAGTQSAQTKSEVDASTKKPFRQKGTGNARQGDLKNPHMIGGGVAFAPKPRSYAYPMPKEKRRQALVSALSIKASEGNVKIVKSFDLPEIKTKAVVEALAKLGGGNALIVDGDNENLKKSARNLAKARYLHHDGLNVFDLLKYETLVITEAAAKALEERLVG